MSSPDPFVTVQDLSDFLGRDLSIDDGAVLAVDAACDICRDVTGQQITAGTATIALDGAGTDSLVLPQRPVLNAGSVSVNGVPETNFMVTPDGTFLRGLPGGGYPGGGYPGGGWSGSFGGLGYQGGGVRPVWPRGRQNIVLTYEFGYQPADVPRSLRMVALMLAARLVIQGVASTETIGETAITYATPATELTANELRILRQYTGTRSF